MQIQPVSNNVLIKLYHPDRSKIITPNAQLSASIETHRVLIEVLAVGGAVEERIKRKLEPGDFLLIQPNVNILMIEKDKENRITLGLVNCDLIIGVTDDVRPS